tara:strand:- start:291 stop:1220 length:930 start_codon:yes stop_codon:yes gene_type:complete
MIRFSKFIAEGADATLADKAKKSGFSLGILKQVYKRGMAAWKVGHKPGTTPQQWGMARVNSFITGGRTRVKGDPDLWAKQKGKIKKPKKEDVNESLVGYRGSDVGAGKHSASATSSGRHNSALATLNGMAKKHEKEHEKSDHLGHSDALKAIDHAGSKLNKHGADHAEFKSAMNKAKDASKKAFKMNNESVEEVLEKHVYRFATKTKQGNIHHSSKDDDGARKAIEKRTGEKVQSMTYKGPVVSRMSTRREDSDAVKAFLAKGGKITKLPPGKAAGYHGKDDPGKGMHGMMDKPDTKGFKKNKFVGSMK